VGHAEAGRAACRRRGSAGRHADAPRVELVSVARRSLDPRVPDVETLTKEVAAWKKCRNE
jgi:hypothetical protein